MVLVHGLWLPAAAMELQRHYLAQMGFNALAYPYPSMRLTLTENADRMAHYARALTAPRIHWVGHSMGGLVILQMLARAPDLVPGRVVLLGSPCRGSYAAREFAENRLGAYALGHSMQEWLSSEKPSDFPGREIGVLAGSRSVGLGRVFARELPVPNDGVVSVAETELAAACDRIVLPVSHTGMLVSRSVAQQAAAFLRDGRFDHRTVTQV